jgi:VanZ family protein
VLPFLLVAIAIIAYGSLYPFHFEITERAANPLLAVWQGWPAEWTRYVLRDVVLNVILYVPPGLAAAMVFLRRHSRTMSALAAILLAFAVSASMELLQVYAPMRQPSSLDVLTNSMGGALGVLIALRNVHRIRALVRAPERGLRGAAAILLAAWAVQAFYPLFPDIGRAHLYDSLSRVLHTRHLSMTDVLLGIAEWLAVGIALECLFERMRTACLAALMLLSLAAQMVIAGRLNSAEEVLAAAIALALWRFSGGASRVRWCAWLLASGILLRELRPFYFLSVPQPFSWVPFAATFEAGRESAVIVIARKAFDYGALVFALRCTGWAWLRAGLVVALQLAAAEAIQTYLPGRTPEITDPLLALLMMLLLMIASPRKVAH